MAAPSPTARTTPTGYYLRDGYRSLVTFASNVDINLWEIESHMPGLDNGTPINITTMHNSDRETFQPQALNTSTQMSFRFAYDPQLMDEIEALVGNPDTITVRLPDTSTKAFYGYLAKVEFEKLVRGTMPMGTATIQPTDYDPSARAEASPVHTIVSGTAG